MRVKLCARCPYTPRDLEGHHDPEAAVHLCGSCDGEKGIIKMHYPREDHRRRKCSMIPNTFGMAQPIAVQCEAESSVSSVTIPGERPLCSKKCAGRFKARRERHHQWLHRFRAA